MIGERFGKWKVIDKGECQNYNAYWRCKCSCKKKTIRDVLEYSLVNRLSQSCGCMAGESSRTHGMSGTREDNIYKDMKHRCYNPNASDYKHYGGRGIKICDEWLNDKNKYFEWCVENGYSDDLTIDRIDNNGDYSPSNCRWVTWKKQQNNRNNNTIIEIDGVSKTLQQWSEFSGVNRTTISARAKRGIKGRDLIAPPWSLD